MKAIICEYHPYDTPFRIGNHHFAHEFLKAGWDVLWISHPVSPLHGLKDENKERMKRAKAGPYQHPGGLIELIPYTRLPFLKAPILSSKWVLGNSHKYVVPPLGKTLRKIGFDKPELLWITDTALHGVADIAKFKALAVRIADDNTEFRTMPESLRGIEDELAGRADVVFVTSAPLQDRLREKYGSGSVSKLHLLRNGVNYEHFQGEFDRPADYKNIDGPIAIYVGAIEEWFAPDWIETLAGTWPDIHVVLIGKPKIDLSEFTAFRNIHILGPKPYETIPSYLAHADCGIIPFRRTRLVESVSPLKLFEFFAAGLPVVSASWTELERLDSPAVLVNSPIEFAKVVSTVLTENRKSQKADEYRAYAMANSWHSRFESAMKALKPQLK